MAKRKLYQWKLVRQHGNPFYWQYEITRLGVFVFRGRCKSHGDAVRQAKQKCALLERVRRC